MRAPAIRGLGILSGEAAQSAAGGSAGAMSGNSDQAQSAAGGSAGAMSGPPHRERLKETVDTQV